MRSFYLVIVSLAVGFVLGWLGRSYDVSQAQQTTGGLAERNKQESSTVSRLQLGTAREQGSSLASPSDVSRENSETSQQNVQQVKPNEAQESIQAATASQVRFSQLLDDKQFEKAMAFYQEIESRGDEVDELRDAVLTRLNSFIKSENNEDFIELVNSYLSAYYNDIEVLLLLAKYNKNSDYFIEALNVYQLANEYALSLNWQNEVQKEFDRFLNEVDLFYSESKSWFLLQQVYERAQLVNMLNDTQQIRLAQIYALAGDQYSAKQVLQQVIASGRNVELASKTLAQLGMDSAPVRSPTHYDSEIKLSRHGSHYAATIAWPGALNTANLMLDTGASITTLSQEAFDRLIGTAEYSLWRTGMFNTANGMARAEIYNFKQVQFGDYQLKDVKIAVMATPMSRPFDGLLGMNILGRFRFHIDQEYNVLELSEFEK